MRGDGYTFSIKVTNSVANEDFQVIGANVSFRPGTEDLSRIARGRHSRRLWLDSW